MQPQDRLSVQRALVSVSNKEKLEELGRGLAQLGVQIYSTGGTARALRQCGLEVQEISHYTGFPEMMQGRVKTLHPKVFAGILRREDVRQDLQAMQQHGIVPFELVVVNLYLFEQTVAREDVTWEEAIEQIDIGGPSLIRAAAKNFRFTTVITSPQRYEELLEHLRQGGVPLAWRRERAAEAFSHTASYDRAIANWFQRQLHPGELPQWWHLGLERIGGLRYGENPHQQAALYRCHGWPQPPGGLASLKQLHGKELSYNNYLDLDAAWRSVCVLKDPAAVVIKHTNPCGAAVDDQLATAVQKALAGDPTSAFGSILGVNRPLDQTTAEVLAREAAFVEAVIAPGYEPQAMEVLTTVPSWRKNVRLVQVEQLLDEQGSWHLRQVAGAVLVQGADWPSPLRSEWQVVTQAPVPEELWAQLEFAWAVVAQVKSNAIVLAREGMIVGVGAGQMSRVDAVRLALQKAGDRAQGAVLASDAFFPFADSIHLAVQAGVKAVIQPGGSRRDAEVIAACDQHQLPMVFTGRRHFRH